MRITGTFLDEITHDIPSNNWGPEEWSRDFQIMRSVGIDTVILIRAGVGRTAACPSDVLRARADTYRVYGDLVEMFLDLAERKAWSTLSPFRTDRWTMTDCRPSFRPTAN